MLGVDLDGSRWIQAVGESDQWHHKPLYQELVEVRAYRARPTDR